MSAGGRENRVFVSPYLCNSLWGFQGLEGAIRTFYPARRLERAWGIPIDVAEHIEQPSLPWGGASVLAGCGVRWLSVPFYGYDSTFGGLKNPPLFTFEGHDGGRVRVVMDRWASGRATYTQGARVLRSAGADVHRWVRHHAGLGGHYPLRAILASGTHGDISPHSGNQARGFAEAIRKYNALPGPRPGLVNATVRQFCQAVDGAQKKRPFLPTIRGCFGHSWDLWPVCLAQYVAQMRRGARNFLAAEALLAAGGSDPKRIRDTQPDRRRAEWCWAMLSDHAWNGTGAANKRHNADLRRQWSGELNALARKLIQRGFLAAGLKRDEGRLAPFNPLSIPRAGLVGQEVPGGVAGVRHGKRRLVSQLVREDGGRVLYFISPRIEGFGFAQVRLVPETDRSAIGARQEPGFIVRFWEVAGRAGTVAVEVGKAGRVFRTNLLERDREKLEVAAGKVTLNLPPHGFAALRFLP